jgi:hypothetical protein
MSKDFWRFSKIIYIFAVPTEKTGQLGEMGEWLKPPVC